MRTVIFQDFIGALVQALLFQNVWQVQGPKDVRGKISIHKMERHLFDFYKSEASKGVRYSQVQRLEPQMFGDDQAPACKLHAAETNGMLAFSVALIDMFGNHLSNRGLWRDSATQLLLFKKIGTVWA